MQSTRYDDGRASPVSSIGTVYEKDQTTQSDEECGDEELERKIFKQMRLDQPTAYEEQANKDPLLHPPNPTVYPQAFALFTQNVQNNLRRMVQELEENELFEQTLLRGPERAIDEIEVQPSASDIDVLMRNMMVVPSTSNTADGPWNNKGKGRVGPTVGDTSRQGSSEPAREPTHTIAATSSARGRTPRSKGKSRRH